MAHLKHWRFQRSKLTKKGRGSCEFVILRNDNGGGCFSCKEKKKREKTKNKSQNER